MHGMISYFLLTTKLSKLARRGHGNSYRYRVYLTPRLDLMKFQMTSNRFSGCFSTKSSNAGTRKGSALKNKCEMSSISTPKWITMAMSRAAKESFSVFETGSSTYRLSIISSRRPAEILSRTCAPFSMTFTSISRHMRLVIQMLYWSMKPNGSEIHEFRKLPRTLVRHGYWR
jgi:hypothetical protein